MKKIILIRVLAIIVLSLILFSDGIQTHDLFYLLIAVFIIGVPWYKLFKKIIFIIRIYRLTSLNNSLNSNNTVI